MAISWKDGLGHERRGPSWRELVDQAASLLGIEDPDLLRFRGTDLQILEYFLSVKGGFAPLTNWLHANMEPPESSLSNSVLHRALASLESCTTFYTTNYDNFLERALRHFGRPTHVIASERDIGGGSAETQVVKFHGDFNVPERMVLSESHYEQRIRLDTEMDLKLRSDVLGHAILFVGYSFRDPNVAYLFRVVVEKFGSLPQSFSGRRAYIIVSNPSDFEMRLFKRREIEVIPVHGIDHGHAVAETLNEMRS
jgi:hypothetical protein